MKNDNERVTVDPSDAGGRPIVELDPADAAVVWGGFVTVECNRLIDILPFGDQCDWDWGDEGPGFTRAPDLA